MPHSVRCRGIAWVVDLQTIPVRYHPAGYIRRRQQSLSQSQMIRFSPASMRDAVDHVTWSAIEWYCRVAGNSQRPMEQ